MTFNMEKKYTIEDVMKAVEEESNRIRIIIEYICNKNSNSFFIGGVDYKTFFDDIQDLENSL